MYLLVQAQTSAATSSEPLKAPVTPELLKLFPLSDKWKRVEGLYEDYTGASLGGYGSAGYNRKIPGWGRMIDGRHVLVLHDHYKGSPYGAWRLYLDGIRIYEMLEVTNEKAAMSVAEVYMKSYKLQFIVKFDQAMGNILQQYEKERTKNEEENRTL
jgi:hypothetical protein